MTVAVYAKGLTVEVRDNAVTPPAGNFAQLAAAPGVVWSRKFTTLPVFDPNNAREGLYHGSATDAVLDNGLRFDIPGRSGPAAGGSYYANFPQFGENETRYVRVRTKWNQALFDTRFLEVGGKPQAGIKFFDINFGDEPGPPIKYHYSSANGKIVVQTYYQCRFPELYAYDLDYANSGFYERTGSDFLIQNAVKPAGCPYTKATGRNGPIVGCFNVLPDAWMTWTLCQENGPLIRDRAGWAYSQSRTRLWGQEPGKPSVLLVDWKPGVPGYFDRRADDGAGPLKMGKIWAFPYLTNKDPTQDHALCQAWYDEFIVSTQPIGDAT